MNEGKNSPQEIIYDYERFDQPFIDNLDKELLNLGMYLSSFNSDEVSKEIERRMMQSDPIIYCKRATLKIAHYI